jgi:anti-sigma factor RsiW
MFISHERLEMSHFTEGVLQAYLDREVEAGAHAQVAAHVSECADCAARLQSLHEENVAFRQAVAALDVVPLPQAALAELRVRAQQQVWRERLRGAGRSWTRAAVLVVGVTAAAVAAVPGSPVREWLINTWRAILAEEQPEPGGPETPSVREIIPEVRTPMSVTPVSGRVRIVLQSPAAGTRVHVQLVDDEKAWVEAATSQFRAGGGVLTAIGATGEVRIALPRDLNSASVEVDGRVYVLKEGETLRYMGPATAQQSDSGLTFRPGRR